MSDHHGLFHSLVFLWNSKTNLICSKRYQRPAELTQLHFQVMEKFYVSWIEFLGTVTGWPKSHCVASSSRLVFSFCLSVYLHGSRCMSLTGYGNISTLLVGKTESKGSDSSIFVFILQSIWNQCWIQSRKKEDELREVDATSRNMWYCIQWWCFVAGTPISR